VEQGKQGAEEDDQISGEGRVAGVFEVDRCLQLGQIGEGSIVSLHNLAAVRLHGLKAAKLH
jgi:hypothetical protein